MHIGYAAGAFDLFHVGHLNLLRHAAQHCDVLIAGVVSDEMLREIKGIDPVIPSAERAEIVESLRFVDGVHLETTPSKMDAWRDRLHPLLQGRRLARHRQRPDAQGAVLRGGGRIQYFPYTMHTSSTSLRRALAALNDGAPHTSSDSVLAL